MNFEEQGNENPPQVESSTNTTPESGASAAPEMPEDTQPAQAEATRETGVLASGDSELEASELAGEGSGPPENGEPENASNERKWGPWIILGVVLAAVVLVLILFANGTFGGSQEATPTAAAAIQPYIQINQPVSGAMLDASQQVLVIGMGGGLFEGNVVVQAHDAAGNVLAEQPTTVQAPMLARGEKDNGMCCSL